MRVSRVEYGDLREFQGQYDKRSRPLERHKKQIMGRAMEMLKKPIK